MKEIIFKEKNFDKIQKILDDVQNRCTARTITIKDMEDYLKKAEAKLELPKKYLDGVKVLIDCNAQDFPRAYKYTPMSTYFCATYKSGSWRITDIDRGETEKIPVKIVLTQEAKDQILKKFEFCY